MLSHFCIVKWKRGCRCSSDDPPDEALSCHRRAWDVPYLCSEIWTPSYPSLKVSKQMVFKMASSLNLKNWHFGARCFWYPVGCLFSSNQRGIKTDGFQNGKLSKIWRIGIFVPVCVCPRGRGRIAPPQSRKMHLNQLDSAWVSEVPNVVVLNAVGRKRAQTQEKVNL